MLDSITQGSPLTIASLDPYTRNLKAKMDINDSIETLSRKAINAALTFNWPVAIELNQEILKTQPTNVDCLNRLGRANLEIGNYAESKKLYQEVLKLDPYNIIAQKNLKRVSAFNGKVINILPTQNLMAVSANSFLEEPGITKVVSLTKLTEPQKLVRLSPGLMVKLNAKSRSVSVNDLDNNYLGVLPDDASHLLIRLINGGNKYQALIKSVKTGSLSILIRETYRSKKFKNQPSFIGDSKAVAYSSDSLTISNDDDSTNDNAELEESNS